MEEYLKSRIRSVQDFPAKGIVFRDITTLLTDPAAFRKAAEALYHLSREYAIDKVVAIESRGFVMGGLLAEKHAAGLVLVRKPGKLPAETLSRSYELEYGSNTLYMHRDAIVPGDRVLVHDDLLATGGTAKAACELVEEAGGKVLLVSFIVELSFLKGRETLRNYDIAALVRYDSE
jgi:adenine phosphoribosyltransferase